MANYGFCVVIFRILLPILITLCVIFRPCGVSVVYLFLLLYFPMVPVPTSKTMSGHTGIYLKVLIAISLLMGLAQVAFQCVLLAKPPYGEFLKNDPTLEKALRHGGFVSLADAEAITVVTWVYPEVLMILTSVLLYCVFRKITTDIPPEGSEETPLVDPEKPVKRNFNLLITIGRYVVLLVLCLAAVLRPSIVGGFYFLVFLSSATWWACYKQLRKGFAIFLRCLMFVVFVHLLAFYVYQFQWIQEFVPEDNRYARYFGLKILLNVTGVNGDDRIFEWGNQEIATYFLPFTLFCLYYVLALESKFLLKPQSPKKLGPFSRLEGSFNTGSLGRQMSQRLSSRQLMRSATTKRRWQSATRKVRAKTTVDPEKITESTPLIRGVSPTRRYGSGKKNSSILQDSTGSVTVTGENTEDIPMEQLGKGTTEDEYIPNVFEKVMFVLESLLQVIIRSSYIATNIIMMAWSITFISWITFVLLLWANLLWLIPNQRKSMLNSSPFLVIYAWFLLISAYIYSMELTDDELPSTIDRFNLSQIGFKKVLYMPCNPLLVKCLFTCMFWITLRQYMQERLAEKQSSALADMVAPLQVTVGTATGVNKEQEKSNKIMEKLGHYLKAFLTRFWIWIVAAVLFAVAITGEKMTLFRIFYMALFLFFILTFQLSFKFWRRMMFGFWLTVIIYSMIILIMVYTYQFDDFPTYWEKYLKVRKQLQEDIGLEVFDVKDLFVRLATPTCFVIITVIQLHYFHKDFMVISDPKTTVPITNTDLENSSLQGGQAVEKSSEKDITTTSSMKFDVSELEHMSTEQFRRVCLEFIKKIYYGLNLLCLFLEIHMPKVVLFFAMVLVLYDHSAFYFVVVVLLSLSLVFGRPLQMFAMYSISVLVSVFLLARMIYQIEYIKQEDWDVTCNFTNGTSNITEKQNIAEWLGFKKVVKQGMLSHLLKWQILYIVIVTFYVVILVRQYNYRISRGKPSTRAFFMFPRITRRDADNDLSTHIKYLLNYGFYKLGVEVCLVATAILIGVRMDMYSVIYSIWLAILFNLSRRVLSKIWPVYLVFIAIFLVIQYFMVIGLPPSLCIELPWDFGGHMMEQLRDWAFLLCSQHPPHAAKLLCDFVLLLLVSRQYVVFRIENRYQNQEYAGGSNESIIHLYEDKNFVNPVPDFVTYVRSYLDVFKRSVLMSFLWITLAVVFLSGTNRINIFSLGYMIGAFVFLWHGTDLYLRPIPGILRLWNWLLGYNVFVILAKSALQIAGCIFLSEISKETCWVGTVFGIGCVRRFGNPIGSADLPKRCQIPKDFVGLAWDVGCFGFLIMQRRIFNSFNFFHMINEVKATTILASRGAELIEELRVKTMLEQDEREKRVLEKIKAKMDRIKATQQKIQGASYKDTTNHDVDNQPMARSPSVASCTSTASQPAGYHTPIEEDDHPPLTPRSSLMQPQAPSPYSAIMTVSLEGYLEPQRISFNSPPNSELNPCPPSPDDSFPVFSPPPYDAAPPYAEAVGRGTASIGPPWMQGRLVTPRQSVFSYEFRSQLYHHEYTIYSGRRKYRRKPPKTYKQAIRSGDYYMFDDLDDEEIDLIDDVGKTPEDDEDLKSKKQSVSEIDEHPKSVTIKDKDDSEPKPSTSKDDEDLSDISEPKEYTLSQRILQGMLFIWVFVESCMLSFTMFLNRRSKDYRYVMKVLTKEKKIMKETTNYTDGLRVGGSQKWHPANSYHNLLAQVSEELVACTLTGTFSPSDSYRNTELESGRIPPKPEHSDSEDKPPISSDDESDTKALATPLPSEQYRRKASVLTVPEIRILAPSLERGLDSPSLLSHQSLHQDPQELLDELEQTEMSSYDQPTYIRLLLAIWVTFMSRSELLCFFVIFLAQISTNTFMSLPLPLMVFFWGSLTVPRPSKTFWITLIAYVEIIVLIKYCFQFKILAQTEAVTDDPQSAIGIDRQGSFANWDLITLLVIFFHRFILKSLGLWKTSTTTVAVLTSGQYKVSSDGKLTPITSSNSEQDPQQKYNSGKYTVSRKSSDSQQLVDDDDDDDQLEDEVDGAVNNKEKHSIQFKEESEQIVSVEAKEVTKFDTFTQGMKHASSKYSGGVKSFFKQLMDPTSRVAADVYSLMFLCDFFNFFVILFGFSAFGTQQDDEGVSSYLEENRVPVLFLLMLILQFFLIIIDRGIYLRKNIVGKLLFQIIQIVLLHIWLFVLYPIITDRKFNSAIPPQLYYMVKCFYFLISAYQIRCGYPTRILGNFLCKGYGYVNMILYKIFMVIPFLFELRTVMDWMWTDTSMTVFDWIKMEDIYSQIFMLKCSRTVEEEYPQERGEKKGSVVKYVMGGLIILCIIVIIWFPLVFFALGNAVGNPNIPYEFSMSIRIGPYEPVYEMTAVANSIFNFTESNQQDMENIYSEKKKDAVSFIQNYDFKDIAAVKFSEDSANIWSISPPERERMVKELNSSHPVPVRLEIKISHKTSLSEDSPVIITESNEVDLRPSTKDVPNEARERLLAMLQGNFSVKPVTIQYIMPKFLKVTNKATAKPVSKLMFGKLPANSYRDITLKLSRNNVTNDPSEYWTLSEVNNTDAKYMDILANLPYYDNVALVIYTFNDKIFSSSLNFITGPGIIGVYTTLILVASNFLKGFFTGQFSKIMFDDLPYVDRLLQLCLDIYLVREAHEYILEEDLFAKLVFLFRSPETLIKWSRPKEEVDDDDDPEAEEAN